MAEGAGLACARSPNLLTIDRQRAELIRRESRVSPQSLWIREAVFFAADRGEIEGCGVEFEPAGTDEQRIASILRLRRARADVFGTGLFDDLAWDILLQLYAASLGNRKIRLSDLDDIAPKSTLARWTSVLEERGLVSCGLDAFKPCNMWIELTNAGEAKMARLFRSLPHSHSFA